MDDDDDEEAPYYCISQLRCSLCRFGLQDGELIVACALPLPLGHDAMKL